MTGEEREKPCLPAATLRSDPFLSKVIGESPHVDGGELAKSSAVKRLG
jgi:hypothetical protein